nr:hypothetical protein [Tanacetum cinerariifolium]
MYTIRSNEINMDKCVLVVVELGVLQSIGIDQEELKVLNVRSDDLNGGIVVVKEVVKWCGGGICGEVVVLVEGVFGIGLERAFMIMDWSILVVVHLRKISKDVDLVVDELALEAMRERDHHMIHKIDIIQECMRVRDANMINKSSEKHPIGKCHIDDLGYTNHSFDNVVGKIEVLSSGKTLEHVAEISIGVVLVPCEAYGILTEDDLLFFEIGF